MILYILTFVLFILLSPGVLYKIPKNMSLMKITIAHATIFTILFVLLQYFMVSEQIENFKDGYLKDDGDDEDITQSSPQSGEIIDISFDDLEKKTEKITQIFSKMSEEQIKDFNKLKVEQFDAFTKIISSMAMDDIEKFILLPIDEILEKIKNA